MWLNQDFNFLLCKNLNSSFSTRLTHSILEVSLHFWLIWPMVGQAGSEWKSMYLYSNRSPVGGTTEAYSNSVYPGALLYQYMLGCWSIKDYDLLAISPMGFFIPEVSWVGLLLEGMKGFSSPFESFRTIQWYWSHFSVGLYDVKYNPTEKQHVILLSSL